MTNIKYTLTDGEHRELTKITLSFEEYYMFAYILTKLPGLKGFEGASIERAMFPHVYFFNELYPDVDLEDYVIVLKVWHEEVANIRVKIIPIADSVAEDIKLEKDKVFDWEDNAFIPDLRRTQL